jgi:hypothetical protein
MRRGSRDTQTEHQEEFHGILNWITSRYHRTTNQRNERWLRLRKLPCLELTLSLSGLR